MKRKRDKTSHKVVTTVPTPVEAVYSDEESTDVEVSEYDHIVEERLPEATADNRVIDDVNAGKVSDAPLHLEFPKLVWNAEYRERAEDLGLTVKDGKFTTEETRILTANWHQFCDDFAVDNPHHFLGYFQYTQECDPIERRAAKEIVVRGQLYLRLAKGLDDRPLVKVYQKARKLFSGLKKAVDLTAKDRETILKLHKHNHKKYEIGLKTFTDIKTVDEVIRHNVGANGCKLKKDKWSEEENQKLIEAIEQVMEQHGVTEHSDIKWPEVAILMANRSALQCRTHFYSIIFLRSYDPESINGHHKWNLHDTQKLVYYLHNNKFEDESEIDWDFLKVKFSELVDCHLKLSCLGVNWVAIKRIQP